MLPFSGFSDFMECISGRRAWGKQKYTQLISKASSLDNDGDKLLTVSDEMFGMLLMENLYMDKWVKKLHIQQKGPPMGRIDAICTAATKGILVFGGWTKQGWNHFSHYCKLVQDDRSSPTTADVQ